MVYLNCSFSCPFCKAASYGVFYRGAKTTEERHRELEVTFVNITMNCYFFHRLKFTDLFWKLDYYWFFNLAVVQQINVQIIFFSTRPCILLWCDLCFLWLVYEQEEQKVTEARMRIQYEFDISNQLLYKPNNTASLPSGNFLLFSIDTSAFYNMYLSTCNYIEQKSLKTQIVTISEKQI